MSIYTFTSLAGSVGKTTTAVALAVLIASRGARVRLIDFDPQANASRSTGYPDAAGQPTIVDVMADQSSISDAERPARVPIAVGEGGVLEFDETSEIPNLSVVPSSYHLEGYTHQLPIMRGGVTKLRRAIAAAPDVDVTLIDAPGTASALVVTAILATQAFPERSDCGVITCAIPESKPIEGISALIAEIGGINEERNTSVTLRGIVPCNVPAPNRGRHYVENLEDLYAGFGELVSPAVNSSVTVAEAYSFYTPVPLYGRARKATREYYEVLEHFVRLGLFSEAE